MDKLNEYRKQFYSIDAMQEPQRSLRLGQLLSSMERTFSIGMLNNKDYNDKNKAVIQLYREVSSSRNI